MVREDEVGEDLGHPREATADPEMVVVVRPGVATDREVATEATHPLLGGMAEGGEGTAHHRRELWACEDLLNQDLPHLHMPTTLTTTPDRHRLVLVVDHPQSWIARRMGMEVLICQ